MEDDYMELGTTGLVPIADGWLLDKETGNRIDPEGRIFDKFNELVYDPTDEEDYDRE